MSKILIVLSGGMDSTTCLAKLISEKNDCETVTFNYGSKHNQKEKEAVKKICDFFKVKNYFIELPFIDTLFKSDLLKSGGKIPEGHYADPSMKKTVVPFRNGIMLSIAAGLAESIGAKKIALGSHFGDHSIYPDCRASFTINMEKAIEEGTYERIEFLRPFENLTKTDIAKIGDFLKVPYELTYSCYNGEDQHCGKCGTCYERKEAFKDSKIKDPTNYKF